MNLAKFVLVAGLLGLPSMASAGTAGGNGALALAALVAENSPQLGAARRHVLAKFLNGQTNVAYPAGKTILVLATKVTCRASNVDLTAHSCDLVFGNKTVKLSGRRAHELFATLAEIGVQPEGAAGSSFEALSKLKCTIKPSEVKQKSGGGAHCRYSPG